MKIDCANIFDKIIRNSSLLIIKNVIPSYLYHTNSDRFLLLPENFLSIQQNQISL